jgi:hypothetical protein
MYFSSNKQMIYEDGVALLRFAKVTPEMAGEYVCEAWSPIGRATSGCNVGIGRKEGKFIYFLINYLNIYFLGEIPTKQEDVYGEGVFKARESASDEMLIAEEKLDVDTEMMVKMKKGCKRINL